MADEDIGLVIPITADASGFRSVMEGLRSNTSQDMDSIKESFRTVGLAVGGAGLAVGGLAVNLSNDLQGALNGVQAQTGLTDQFMGDMRSTMLDIYNDNFGESFDDIGQAMSTINQQTGMSGEELKKVTEGGMALRDTFGFEVNESIRSANQLMTQFGMSGKDAYSLIAQGAQWGLDKNGDLLDSINEYSVQFKGLGFNAEEMFNMLQNGAAGGAFSVDKLGDAVKEFGIRAKDGSKSTSEAFQALGLDANSTMAEFAKGGESGKLAFEKVNKALLDMKDPLAQNQVGTALWGSMWEDLGKAGVSALTNTQGEISKTVDSLGKINEIKYNTFGQALQGIKRQLETGLLLPLGEQLLPKLNEFANYLKQNLPGIIAQVKPVIEGIGNAFMAVFNNLNILAPILAGVLVGIQAYKVIDTVSSLINAFRLATVGATTAQQLFNLAIRANPVGAVATVIGLVIAGIVLLIMNWDKVKAKTIEVFGAIRTAVEPVLKSIANFFTVTIPEAIGTMIQFFSSLPGKITEFFAGVLNAIVSWGASVLSWITTSVPLIIDGIINFFNTLPERIGYALGFAIGTLIKWGIDAVNWVIAEVPKIIENIRQFFSELPGKLAEIFVSVMSKIGEWGSNVISWISTEVPKFIMGIVNFYAELPGKIYNFLVDVITKMGTWISNMRSKVSSEIPGIVSSISEFFSGLPGKMLGIGRNIVEGLWNGISGAKDWIWGKIKGFAQGILDGLKHGLGIQSPSKLTMEMGSYLGQGLVLGMDSQIGNVGLAMNRMVGAVNLPKSYTPVKQNSSSYRGSEGGNSSIGNLLKVDKMILANDLDIRDLAYKIEAYRGQIASAKGGR